MRLTKIIVTMCVLHHDNNEIAKVGSAKGLASMCCSMTVSHAAIFIMESQLMIYSLANLSMANQANALCAQGDSFLSFA